MYVTTIFKVKSNKQAKQFNLLSTANRDVTPTSDFLYRHLCLFLRVCKDFSTMRKKKILKGPQPKLKMSSHGMMNMVIKTTMFSIPVRICDLIAMPLKGLTN